MSLERWDHRFLQMAKLISGWSKDPSTKCGAVIVRPDRTIVSVGYNGFPKKIKDNTRLLHHREAKYQRIVHCEMNAILNTGDDLNGCTLYTWPFLSCNDCAKHVITVGIERCVAPLPSPDVISRWEAPLKVTRALFKEAGIQVKEYDIAT